MKRLRLAALRARHACVSVLIALGATPTFAAEHRVTSPDGRLALVLSDEAGLRYRVEREGRPVLSNSELGLEFADGLRLGPAARFGETRTAAHDGTWENPFGARRHVPDSWRELRVALREAGEKPRDFALVVRAYDVGVAFRYELPAAFGSDEFVLAAEHTEFRFPADHRAWAGGESTSAETEYPETRLSAIPRVSSQKNRQGRPYLSVLPLLVETPSAYVAIAESGLLGPMDFTPGGFLNRLPADFRVAHPAQDIGTRVRPPGELPRPARRGLKFSAPRPMLSEPARCHPPLPRQSSNPSASRANHARPPSARALDPMGRLGRVLVVDDDESIRLRVRDLLESAGRCEIDEAADGLECLAAVSRHPPDLILLDLMMPGMSGLEVCTALRHDPATREIPIIVLSAAHEEEARPAALDAGAEDYLCKPIPAQELRAKVANIMRLNRYHALKQERDRLRWLFENSREAIVRVSRSGHLREANHVAHSLFGLPALEFPARTDAAPDALAVIALHYRPDPPDAFDRIRAHAPLPEEGFALHRPESNLLAARWFQVDVHQDADTPSADLLLKFTDHSALVHHHLETWSFQHLISHKIRTPLNGVGATLDFLIETPDVLVGDEARELLLAARDSSHRLEDTLLSILRYHQALCSPSDKTNPALPLPWDLLLREAAGDAGLAPARLRLVGDAAPTLPPGLVEPMRLALAELIENYLKFSHAEQAGLEARLSAPADAPPSLRLFAPGPALAPEIIARLGLPYWQLEKKFTGEIPGMGLGLATSRLLLRSLGAELVFSASTQPEGLVAAISLPPRP